VTDGDLFADKTKVKMTFVDGAKFEPRDAPKTGDGDKPTGEPSGEVTGTRPSSVTEKGY
jgi:hypothetical protein